MMKFFLNQILYKMFQPFLFKLDPERAHQLSLSALKLYSKLYLDLLDSKPKQTPVNVMGLNFSNPIGLAAGFDKDGHYIEALNSLGFGFLEIGTVTPKPQAGHTPPRFIRLDKEKAILNRMGFNNEGVFSLMQRLEKLNYPGIIGINIGKNKQTPIDLAHEDYLLCYRKVYSKASYVVVNISSPNTPHLKALQFGVRFNILLSSLKEEQARLTQRHGRKVPLVLKIAPDLSLPSIENLATKLLEYEWEGVIATNTLPSHSPFEGGLSGQPLFHSSTELLKILSNIFKGKIPIIASGGILSAEDAMEKFTAGASLIQIYTGLIYQGPKLIHEISESFSRQKKALSLPKLIKELNARFEKQKTQIVSVNNSVNGAVNEYHIT